MYDNIHNRYLEQHAPQSQSLFSVCSVCMYVQPHYVPDPSHTSNAPLSSTTEQCRLPASPPPATIPKEYRRKPIPILIICYYRHACSLQGRCITMILTCTQSPRASAPAIFLLLYGHSSSRRARSSWNCSPTWSLSNPFTVLLSRASKSSMISSNTDRSKVCT